MIPWSDALSPSGEGETFGQYQLVKRLAVGGMAEVFLATIHGEAGFTKPVVIKRLHPQHSEDRSFVRMLIDEANITARLSHSNICQVLDLGLEDGSYFIAMEYIPGEDLGSLIDRCIDQQMVLSIEAVFFIMCEVLAGLDYAHRRVSSSDRTPLGIVHRDISPQNILISYEGEVKIIDFGIAKARSRLAYTEAGVIKGKFRYMSPEQVEGDRIDLRSDIFAAGIVLYELLRGGPHALDLSDSEVIHRIREAQFEPLHRFRPDLTRGIERIVSRALNVRPDDRYLSAEAFRADLLRQLQQMNARFGKPELADVMRGAFEEERRLSRSRLLFESMKNKPKNKQPEQPRYIPRQPTLPIPRPLDQVETVLDPIDSASLEALPPCHLKGTENAVVYPRSPECLLLASAAPAYGLCATLPPHPSPHPFAGADASIMTSAREEEDDQCLLERASSTSSASRRSGQRRRSSAGRFSRPAPEPAPEEPEAVTEIAAQLDEPTSVATARQPSTSEPSTARPSPMLRTLFGLVLVLVTCGGLAVGAVLLSL